MSYDMGKCPVTKRRTIVHLEKYRPINKISYLRRHNIYYFSRINPSVYVKSKLCKVAATPQYQVGLSLCIITHPLITEKISEEHR